MLVIIIKIVIINILIVQYLNQDVNSYKDIILGGENMENDVQLQDIAKKLRNEKAREWRLKNKEKIKDINKRYWLKRAKEYLEKETKG